MAVFVFEMTAPAQEQPVVYDATQFMAQVESGQVSSIKATPTNGIYQINGVLKDGTEFTTTITENFQGGMLEEYLRSNGVETVTIEPTPSSPWWLSLIGTFLPLLLIFGLMFFMMQQAQGGGNKVMQFGKSKAHMQSDDKKRVTFADAAGVDEAKEELVEVVDFLKNPEKYNEIGARIPKGILLVGPPGTGKTLLARAVAGEAGVPFFSISGSDFVEMFVGVGAARVRDLFEQAKKNSPCIVFIDEIDAVGRQRGAGLGGGHDEREQTLNQLLVEMDGFASNEGVVIMAATNRPDILDPALLRPGRFDRHIVVDIPDIVGRKEILKVHARGKKLGDDVDLDVIARRTPGFTGADLANVFNEAALLAARRRSKTISLKDMEDAVERIIAGPEKKSRAYSDYEKRLVAYHESGHALCGHYLPNTDPLHKVSIIPRGRAGGYTLLLPKEDRRFMTKSQLLDEVTMLLGGRVAEALVLKDVSTGAQNDLERATAVVRKMITEYGMSDELGPLTFGNKEEQVFLGRDLMRERNYSEAVAFSIDKEQRRIIEECYQKAEKLLSDNLEKLHLVAQTLMEKETLEAAEFESIIEEFDAGKSKEEILSKYKLPKDGQETRETAKTSAAAAGGVLTSSSETAADDAAKPHHELYFNILAFCL